MSQIIQDMAEEIKKSPSIDEEKGYNNLMQDLIELLRQAKDFEFDDFKNTKYIAPKVQLRNIFLKLAQNVIEGRYDNDEKEKS